jgi:hypothetical protein
VQKSPEVSIAAAALGREKRKRELNSDYDTS